MLTVTKILDIFKNVANKNDVCNTPKPPSSSGLGHLPFTEATGIQIPLGVLQEVRVRLEAWLLFFCGDSYLNKVQSRFTLEIIYSSAFTHFKQ
jgi:hypothetical protein